ncbi:MAG: Photosystem I reaction center subunit IX [Cyanobacteria bacterium P01_F01_bin.150]
MSKNFKTYLSFAPVLLTITMLFTATTIIVFNWLVPDLLLFHA